MPRFVPARQPSDALRVTGPIVLAVAGLALGVVSRLARPMIAGGIHYEAIAAFALLVLSCVGSVFLHRRIPWRRAMLSLQVHVVVVWLTFVVGWSFIEQRMWSDILGVSAAWWLACAVGAALLLVLIQRWRKPVIGHVCPHCGYDFTGRNEQGGPCPECGRG